MLHSCCAPCSGAILEWMIAQGIRPVVFFSNSNISTREEYDKRFTELERYCRDLGVELVNDEYNHAEWLDAVLDRAAGDSTRSRELAEMPERGERCFRCFKYRLERAVRKAEELGCGVLTTSLASSRWKDLDQVNEAGQWACDQTGGAVLWWDQNWRKGGLQERRNEIIREKGFYNQKWCGCEFSIENMV